MRCSLFKSTNLFFDEIRYFTDLLPGLGNQRMPAGVGKMWGGTSNHNGFMYDRGYVTQTNFFFDLQCTTASERTYEMVWAEYTYQSRTLINYVATPPRRMREAQECVLLSFL